MRQTYSDLFTDFLQNTGNLVNSSDSNLEGFFKRHLATRYQLILSKLANHTTQLTQTASTANGQQYYHYPPGIVDIEAMTLTLGSEAIPVKPINSQLEWDRLNQVSFTSGYPEYFFARRDDFGIWPIPNDTYTLTLNYHYRDRSLTTADYVTGTVTVTQNSQTLTGAGTTWTSAMVGRWFKLDSNGYWYRISGFTSTTSLTLESVYEGASASGGSYVIGESPEIPEEGHILLSYGPTADYYFGPKKDPETAQKYDNLFWTGDAGNSARVQKRADGGLLHLIEKYSSRSNSRLVQRRHGTMNTADSKLWATTISE